MLFFRELLIFLTKQTDSQEQYSRRSCIPINGIEKAENESTTDCVNKVIDIFKDVEDVHLSAEDIDRAHRVGREKKTMIVKFYSFVVACLKNNQYKFFNNIESFKEKILLNS